MAPEILVATSTARGTQDNADACLPPCLKFAWIMSRPLRIGAGDGSKNNRWADEFRRQGVDIQVWPDQVQDLAAVKLAVTLVQPQGVLQQVSRVSPACTCGTRSCGGAAALHLG